MAIPSFRWSWLPVILLIITGIMMLHPCRYLHHVDASTAATTSSAGTTAAAPTTPTTVATPDDPVAVGEKKPDDMPAAATPAPPTPTPTPVPPSTGASGATSSHHTPTTGSSSSSSSTGAASSAARPSVHSSAWHYDEREVGAALDAGFLSHRPMILLPGFASSRLRVWQSEQCQGAALQFRPGDAVWLNLAMVVGARSCWLSCMKLDPFSQDDARQCRGRPDDGLDAITQLEPGLILGPLSDVFGTLVESLTAMGLQPKRTLVAWPYDWRLAPEMNEQRDGFYSSLRVQMETMAKRTGRACVVVAHSMGNNIFRYYLEWLRHDLGSFHYQSWLDKHIDTYVAAGAPMLGAAEPIRSVLSGSTFGLPIPEASARDLLTTFASIPWMMAYDPARAGHISPYHTAANPASNGEYPLEGILEMTIPPSLQSEAVAAEHPLRYATESIPVNDVSSGDLFHRLTPVDHQSGRVAAQISSFYQQDHVLNPIAAGTPWQRPKLRKVICAYGTGLRTDLGYRYKYQQGQTADTSEWLVTDTIVEESDRIFSLSGQPVALRGGAAKDEPTTTSNTAAHAFTGSPRKSGDGTVPYYSLSWCHHWLGPVINVTRVPQKPLFLDGEVEHYSDVDAAEFHRRSAPTRVSLTIDPTTGRTNASPSSSTGSTAGSYNTFFSHYEVKKGHDLRETHVWELDLVVHRGLIQHPVFLRELRHELMDDLRHDLHARRRRRKAGGSNRNDGAMKEKRSTRSGAGTVAVQVGMTGSMTEIGVDITTDDWVDDDRTDMEGILRRMEAEARMHAHIARRHAGRPPASDDDCDWDYAAVRCRYPTHCVYDYRFGDYHLSQSCRLRPQPLLTSGEELRSPPPPSSSSSSSSSSLGGDDVATSPSSSSSATSSTAVAAAAAEAASKQCQCTDQSCVHGFCRYHSQCEHSTQAFGPSNGWWGPCTSKTNSKQ